jgi:hypothetical protein
MKCPYAELDCPYVDTLWMIKEVDCERCENYPGNEWMKEEEVEEEETVDVDNEG